MYEKTISRKTVFEGRILDVDVLEVELEDGRRSVREIVRHGVAVAIIPQLPDGRFVFIRQFRKAMERVCFEVVAGNCDPGEEPAVSAARELKEETGYAAQSMELLGPGFQSVQQELHRKTQEWMARFDDPFMPYGALRDATLDSADLGNQGYVDFWKKSSTGILRTRPIDAAKQWAAQKI